MRILAALFLLLTIAGPVAAQLPPPGAEIPPYSGPFPGKAILVFTRADHATLTHALRHTPYHAAFRRAKSAKYLSDGAVPGLVPVVLGPKDADRLWRELDRGRLTVIAAGRLRNVLHATARLAWSDPDAPKGAVAP